MLSLVPLHPTFGVEVGGVDPGGPLDAPVVAELRGALDAHGLLVFRRVELDGAGLVRFGRAFGELEVLPEPDKRDADHPEIFDLTNVRPDGTLVGFEEPQAVFLRGTERWHTDSSFRTVPCLATMLHAVEVPASGSRTQFADMCQAWEVLTDDERRRLADVHLVHSYEYSRANNPGEMDPMDPDERARFPPVTHPLVRTLPDGRRALYLGGHVSHVAGTEVEAGRALVAEVLAAATEERFVHTHRWAAGDLVVWDNRRTLHRLLPYAIDRERRVMRRVTVAGTDPVV